MAQSGSIHQAYFGPEFDRFVQRYDNRSDDNSRIIKMQKHYYEAKQKFIRKLKKKEDDCIVASDALLDSKLELCKSIEDTCSSLLYVLEAYEERLYCLAHEENATGKFLKEEGKQDKTQAGKMMTATGKTLCYTAQQRVQLRDPLVRFYKDVETFQYRAIADMFVTINKMEKARIEYRGALLWMKDLSQELDPDTYKQLDKFRKVQDHVRKSKMRFDKLKLDTLQKIDMLSASRCNMFSHALLAYQNCLNTFWEKTSRTMNAISESFKGYQHYEFNMLKELTETSKKLAQSNSIELTSLFDNDKDSLIFFDSEYYDENEEKKFQDKRTVDSDSKDIKDLLTSEPLEINEDDLLGDFLSDNYNEPNKPKNDNEEFFSENFSDVDMFLNRMSLETDEASSKEKKNETENQIEDERPKKKEWFNLFAELDPLSNPDSLGKNEDPNRNC